ncbi:MAG TPA: hypothetical protein VGO67_03835 [Verrucomicrobiae bacterium]|jgi:hypothetical protein
MKFPQLPRIQKAIRSLRNFTEEQNQMDAMEKRADADLATAAEEGSLTDENVRRKIARAQSNLNICAARRGAVERGIRNTVAELTDLIRQADRLWSAEIRPLQEALQKRIVEAMLPFYPAEEKMCHRLFSDFECPARYDISRAALVQLTSPFPKDPEKVIEEAARAIRHIQHHAKKLNITLEVES